MSDECLRKNNIERGEKIVTGNRKDRKSGPKGEKEGTASVIVGNA
jgi:hypothetical protein